jgi:hypothetical protein
MPIPTTVKTDRSGTTETWGVVCPTHADLPRSCRPSDSERRKRGGSPELTPDVRPRHCRGVTCRCSRSNVTEGGNDGNDGNEGGGPDFMPGNDTDHYSRVTRDHVSLIVRGICNDGNDGNEGGGPDFMPGNDTDHYSRTTRNHVSLILRGICNDGNDGNEGGVGDTGSVSDRLPVCSVLGRHPGEKAPHSSQISSWGVPIPRYAHRPDGSRVGVFRSVTTSDPRRLVRLPPAGRRLENVTFGRVAGAKNLVTLRADVTPSNRTASPRWIVSRRLANHRRSPRR